MAVMAKANFSFKVPGREDDEPDLTAKQLSFIQHLAEEISAEGLSKDRVRGLGKLQASALIDRLIEIRDGTEGEKLIRTTSAKSNWMGYVVLAVVVLVILAWLLS
jgi:uncharacterized membrane protein YcjF (UPF0283 family)